ncbi:hypothetical protein X798_01195 [Onchocerca flexuosa]|uniref:DUF148 domain-containing protein n=2 Tax=Onchocerca flexuosa TaxID=387005 RepID=A0A183GY20_9BILA|nr:hypothetical protein X798_01195 [Onchocerca flexuosa]VDO24655.1 unnamed protein product [Onchocerca flexuosa]
MWFIWIIVVNLHFNKINAQFNNQIWQYRSPAKYQIMEKPTFFSNHEQSHLRIPIPVYEFKPNLYPISFPVSVYPSLSPQAFTVPTPSLQNLPFQSTWMTNNPPQFTNQKEYIGYVTEIKKSDDVINRISTKPENDYDISIQLRNNLPDFLCGTSDDVQKKFYKIVLNPDESFQQKQSKLDQLVSTLDKKNQELYDRYRQMKELEERKKRDRVHAIVASMSNKAQTVFAKLSAVLMNPKMKDMDRMNKINDFYKNVDDDVKKEFKDRINDLNLQL